MQITNEMRFPYPVLDHESDDYNSGEFNLHIEVIENPEKSTLSLSYATALTENQIRQLVSTGKAGVGIYVTCRDTYYSNLIELSLLPSRSIHHFPSGKLVGRVAIRPVVWSKKSIAGYETENCNEEFGDQPIDLPPGSILAMSDEVVISVGREKLTNLETIFSLAESEALPKSQFNLRLDDDRITILVASDLYETVNNLRGMKHGRAIMLNSVYLPAVMETLLNLQEQSEQYDEKRWYRIFTAKCDHLSIDLEESEPWVDAQRLLSSPFAEIYESRHLLGD